jgi:hypothetical protein
LSKIAAELKINIGVLNLTFGHQPTEKNRQEKLNLIIRYLKEESAVGTVDSPKEYFEGVLPMQWGPFAYPRGENSDLIYFGDTTTSGTILGLGGSMHHRVGEQRGESTIHSVSSAPAILAFLSKELDVPSRWRQYSADLEDTLYNVMVATRGSFGPTQNLEFVAKRLLEGSHFPWYDGHIVLGTPIYVAQAD